MIDLRHASALSVDLFDTLLLRAVAEPDDVFRRVGGVASARAELRPHVTPIQFQVMRRHAEDLARQRKRAVTGSSEVSLPEVYAALPAGVLAAHPDVLADRELQVEGQLVYPHPEVLATVSRARAKGLRVAILSDTCYSAHAVSQLLLASGIDPSLFDLILTSSDEGVSKHDGGLFERLRARWPDITPGSILHVGDNPSSDRLRARSAGLDVAAHDTGAETLREVFRLEDLRYRHLAPEIASLRRLAVSLSPPMPDEERWWFELGASVLGPLLSAFADWVVAGCTRDGISIVRPLMREGALLTRLIERAALADGARLDVRPLYVSRASTWLAGVHSFGNAEVAELLQRQWLTAAEALAAVGLDVTSAPDAVRSLAAEALHGARIGSVREAHDGVARVLSEFLCDSEVRRQVDHAAEARRDLLLDYVAQECGRADHVALVDIGFRGSIGVALDRASAGAQTFHQFLLFGAAPVSRLWTAGHDVRLFAGGPGYNADLSGAIVRHPALVETLLMDGGTTTGYARVGDRIEPVLDRARVSSEQVAWTKACRDGVVAFQEQWLAWRRLRPGSAGAVMGAPRTLLEPLHRLLTLPTTAEALKLGVLVHEDNAGGASSRKIASVDGVPVEATLRDVLRPTAVEAGTSGWLWPAGVCAQRWPGALERQWRDLAGSSDGAPAIIPSIARRARVAGVRRCIIWGAGEVGLALLHACRSEGVDVHAVADSNPALWGTSMAGVSVVSPDEAASLSTDAYAIGSLAFAHDIARSLHERSRAKGSSLRIFSALDEEAA